MLIKVGIPGSVTLIIINELKKILCKFGKALIFQQIHGLIQFHLVV